MNYQFSDDSTVIPSQQELDNLLIQAFQQPNVQALVFALRGLPSTNPFSTVVDVSYTSEDGTVYLENRSVSGAGVVAIAAACLLAASAAGLVVTNRARRRGTPLLNGSKSSVGDAPKVVVASDAEDTMSECTASIARPPSPSMRHSQPTLNKIDEENEATFSSMKEGRRLARGYGFITESKDEEEGDDR